MDRSTPVNPPRIRRMAFVLAVVGLTSVGCGDPTPGNGVNMDPVLLERGAAFLLADEPAEVIGVIEARENLDERAEVAVIGRVGGVAHPWQRGRASFVISDPSVEAVDDAESHSGECGDGCAFCARTKAENATLRLAIVHVVDDQGEVVSGDARQLFGLELGQLVVVQGQARVDNLGNLILSAAGIYVRR